MFIIIIIDIIKNIDAIVCTIKYVREASFEVKSFFIIINGIKDIMLISIPIHTTNHEFDEIEIITLNIKININNMFVDLLIIRKRNYIHWRGMNPLALFSLFFYTLLYDALKFLIL